MHTNGNAYVANVAAANAACCILTFQIADCMFGSCSMVNIWDTRKLGKAAKPLHELPHAKSCQVPRVMLHLFYATGLYPTRRGIPPGVVSRPAWYPARRGIPRGTGCRPHT